MSASWRMDKPCADCPFSSSEAGTHLRESLSPGRMDSIKEDLLRGGVFYCHKTVDYDRHEEEDGDDTYRPDGRERFCAGALQWQNDHGASSNLQRVCERLEWMRDKRRGKS